MGGICPRDLRLGRQNCGHGHRPGRRVRTRLPAIHRRRPACGCVRPRGIRYRHVLSSRTPSDATLEYHNRRPVVLNLILNAVEAMGSVEAGARELLISTAQDHTGVRVAVRGSGPGIDPTYLERVFEAFYTTKSSGMGMGLSVCRSIIDAHGGRLWADVNEPRGAVFQFTLPAAQEGS